MRVIYVYADSAMEWNCSEWRMLAPSDAINKAAETDPKYKDWAAKLIHVSGFMEFLNPALQNLIGPAQIIIVQRNIINQQVIDAIRYWQGMGKAVAVDLDDQYQSLPWSNPAHPFWLENSAHLDPPPLQMLEEGLRITNALISPNRFLLQDWSHVCKGYYLQNFARGEWWENLPTRAEQKAARGLTDRIVIGWGGSVSHYDSWWGSNLREAASIISRLYPQVVWMVCGNDPRIYDQLPVPRVSKYQQPGVDAKGWPAVVATFDIGVAPLFGPYDQRRSWIKTLEYNLAGVPWVATGGEPYREHAQLGTLVDNKVDSWVEALTKLIQGLPEAQAQAAIRVPFARRWYVANQLDTLGATYDRIISEFRYDTGALPSLYFVNWSN